MGATKKIQHVFDEIAYSYQKVKLTATQQPVMFETTNQQFDRDKISNSVSDAKKIKTFLWEYNTNNQKINGMDIVSIFAEKKHAINDFGLCDTSLGSKQIVIVLKPTATADSILKSYDNLRWVLSAQSGGLHYIFYKKSDYEFSCSVPFIDDPDVLQLTYVTGITHLHDFDWYTLKTRNQKMSPLIKAKLVFYRPNTNKLKTVLINKDSL
ncbi:hypothetical protein JN11_04840 [Mucilaginibacter frigoritolerans]|uniref:Uncharacterized protein n=1 Tax=Mucilaginibacter frigoritolerans TaxID=652788 RepID=A0A562TKY2_9SPHI|nr:hypothetical protein [Mucilaginibacter frigoritolerans]TWI94023.1 hypothetical protein JN11_04840 [Mucilaginibacter frigoritolerans]